MSNARRHPTIGIKVGAMAAAVLLGVLAIGARPAIADDALDARQLVERARLTFESFSQDPYLGENLQALVNKAKAVLIYPQNLRAAFIFGASGGSGVLLARDPASGGWFGPAFYTIGQASFGLQAGADASEVVLVALSDRGLSALLATSAKLGADASVALGPIGAGLSGATQNISADIVSYSRNKGLYAGLSVDGAVVATRDSLNAAYFGTEVSPTDILIKHTVTNQDAAGLIADLTKVTGGSVATR